MNAKMKEKRKKNSNGWWRTAWRRLKSLKSVESLGWAAFAVVFLILAYPGILLAQQITYQPLASNVGIVSLGLFSAAVGSAFITWGLNSIVVWRVERRKEAARASNNRKKRRK